MMVGKFSLLNAVSKWPLVRQDDLAGLRCYGTKSGEGLDGEISHMHVLFSPITDQVVTELEVVQGEGMDATVLRLPEGYGEMLMETNGAMLFAGHLIFYGLDDPPEPVVAHLVDFRPVLLSVVNLLARDSALGNHLVHLGTYYATRRYVVFDLVQERVGVWSREAGLERTWPSFGCFIEEEFFRLQQIFDQYGRSGL